MRPTNPGIEKALRAFLARLPPQLPVERAILYGSRARGDARADSDADLALILALDDVSWQLVQDLGELAFYVLLDTGVLIQPVPIALAEWLHPERSSQAGFLDNIAREGIAL